jgi:hypothetical protein
MTILLIELGHLDPYEVYSKHTSGPFGSLLMLVDWSVTGVRCHSEERSNAHSFERHDVDDFVRINSSRAKQKSIA